MSQALRGLSPNAPIPPELLDWQHVHKVLLVRLRSIGDTVLMTPCLAAIKSWRPDIRITVVSEKLAAPILERHELLDELAIVGNSARDRLDLIRNLRRGHFDIAFNLHGGTTATVIAALSKASTTVGYDGYRYSRLLRMRAPTPDRLLGRTTLHSVEQQLALLCWAGVPWPQQAILTVPVSPDAVESVRNRLKLMGVGYDETGSGSYAVLSPGASAGSKMWPAGSFAEVAGYLKRHYGLASVVIAGPGEERLASRIAASTEGSAVVLSGADLKEIVALIAHSSAFVGNDSGPMHIAAAFQRPLVAIFGGSNPQVWRPWTEGPCRVLTPPALEDEDETRDSVSGGSRAGARVADIRRIGIGEVLAAIDDVMGAAQSGFAN